MGTIDFYGTIHIKWCLTSKEKMANEDAIAYCEWALQMNTEHGTSLADPEGAPGAPKGPDSFAFDIPILWNVGELMPLPQREI